eukprot:GHUV01006190.1.p2 GENE.GHUV01006190.1~~GHUV01006190.1.p2  ORF type:complete len:195 (+),score=35.37 GHUV01006190.1:1625-2209(+)
MGSQSVIPFCLLKALLSTAAVCCTAQQILSVRYTNMSLKWPNSVSDVVDTQCFVLFYMQGNVIFKDIFDSLGKDKARADVAFDPQRVENTGMAISTSFFFQMKFAAEKWGLTASWADVMVYSGKCGNTSQMRMWYKQSIASAQTEVVHKYQYTCITGYHFVSLSVALCPWYIQGRRACRHLYSNMAWTSVEPCC